MQDQTVIEIGLAAIAGLVLVGRQGSANALSASGMELQAIAAYLESLQ